MWESYRALEKIAPDETQKFAVLSYVLFDQPVNSKNNQGNNNTTVGMFIFIRAFETSSQALKFANALLEQVKVRTVVVTRACRFRNLETVVVMNQIDHVPLSLDSRLMEQHHKDKMLFMPTYQIRTDRVRLNHLHERSNNVLSNVSAQAMEVMDSENQVRQLEKLLETQRTKVAASRKNLKALVQDVTMHDWVTHETTHLHELMETHEVQKMHDLVSSTFQEILAMRPEQNSQQISATIPEPILAADPPQISATLPEPILAVDPPQISATLPEQISAADPPQISATLPEQISAAVDEPSPKRPKTLEEFLET